MNRDITLGSMVFPSDATSGWFWSDVKDWYKLSDDKMDINERPSEHGAFGITRSLRSSLAVVLEVTYIASSRADLLRAQAELTGVGAAGPVLMTVADDLGTTGRVVSVRNIDVPPDRALLALTYTVDVLARDPRRFAIQGSDGFSRVSTFLPTPAEGLFFNLDFPIDFGDSGNPGQLTLTNHGTAPAYPRFEVFGGLTAFTLKDIGTGSELTFNLPVPESSSVVLDANLRTATVGGVSDATRWLKPRDWFSVPPGGSSTIQFSGVASGGTPIVWGELASGWW